MPAAFPAKTNWVAGGTLAAADLDNIGMLINLFRPTAKGALFTASAADTVSELAIGSTSQVLTVVSGAPAWATPSSGTPSFVGCVAWENSNQAFNNTATAIIYSTDIFDTNAFHDTASNKSRMTIPTSYGGKYLFTFDINLASTASMQNLYLMLYKNGAAYTVGLVNGYLQTMTTGQPQDGHWNVSIIVDTVAGDYWEMFIKTGSSASTIDKARFGIQWLGA